MPDKKINPSTIVGQINQLALDIIENSPDGIRWVDLLQKIQESEPKFHPKTVNGCVWKLVENFPDRVHKPSKGLFKSIIRTNT